MNIAVIFGGESCEHDISIITGEQLISKIDKTVNNVIPIYINKYGDWLIGNNLNDIDNFPNNLGKTYKCSLIPNDNYLYIMKGNKLKRKIQIDVVLVCLHGLRGEDGTLASILEHSKIPYSSCSICASSICMDKVVFKYFAKGLGINVVDGISVNNEDFIKNKDVILKSIADLGYPVILKPSRQGSSIGVDVCESEEKIVECLNGAFQYDNNVLIEKFMKIEKEVNIAIIDNKGELILSNTEEPITSEKFLNFNDKYCDNTGFETIKRKLPAEITEEQYSKIVTIAKKCYIELKMFGVVRLDFIISNGGEIFLNEINTIPGSLAYYLFDKSTYSYEKLIELMISNAIYRKNKNNEILKIFNTDVLNNGFNGLKK